VIWWIWNSADCDSQWNDIDCEYPAKSIVELSTPVVGRDNSSRRLALTVEGMRSYREFQFDDNFAPAEYKAFVEYLHQNDQYYVGLRAHGPLCA
jgi:hypothetical protein